MKHCHIVHLPSNNISISMVKLYAFDDKELNAHFKKAVTNVINPQDPVSAFPPSTMVSHHLFKKMAIPGLLVE
ncbi:MAG TPA: hypothetical protein VH796_14430 [Nitrososphaeraceae archaeon]